jgi:DNA-binding protein YbaB
MTSPQQAFGEIFAEVNRMQKDLAAFRERVDAISASATAPKRMLTVTVNHKGELTKLKFNTTAFRDMSAAELSNVVLETINQARGSVSEKVKEAMSGITGIGGLSMEDMRSGNVDLQKLVPATLPTSPSDVLTFLRGGQPSAAGQDAKE